MIDFSIFAGNWLRNDCSSANNFYDGTDMNQDTVVNWADFSNFASQWLYDCK